MRRLVFYVDGSAIRQHGENRRVYMGCGVVGVVGVAEDGDTVEWSFSLGKGTDGQAELLAVIKALTKVLDRSTAHVVVHTDSQYAIYMLTGKGVARANLWLVEAAKALVAECGQFDMEWCKAHSGDPLNDRADTLAKQGARASIPLGKNGLPEL